MNFITIIDSMACHFAMITVQLPSVLCSKSNSTSEIVILTLIVICVVTRIVRVACEAFVEQQKLSGQ